MFVLLCYVPCSVNPRPAAARPADVRQRQQVGAKMILSWPRMTRAGLKLSRGLCSNQAVLTSTQCCFVIAAGVRLPVLGRDGGGAILSFSELFHIQAPPQQPSGKVRRPKPRPATDKKAAAEGEAASLRLSSGLCAVISVVDPTERRTGTWEFVIMRTTSFVFGR